LAGGLVDCPSSCFRTTPRPADHDDANAVSQHPGERLTVGSHGDDVWAIGTDGNVYNW